MKHFMNNSKELEKMIEENNKYRQGRSKRQLESSYKGAFYAWVGMLITFIVAALLN